jgi:prepilin-type N-terminal cleavage/methylation domain-containing protein
MKKTNRAFSLIELSIVVLIIGIIIAGVTGASSLVRKMRVSTAQSLTKSSDVNSISGLKMWLETTSENAMTNAGGSSSLNNGDEIAKWIDSNPQSTNKIDVSSISTNRPTYSLDGLGGIPAISFNGSQFLFNSSSVPLAANSREYTIVAVWRKNSAATNTMYVFSQGSVSNNAMAALTYHYFNNSYGFTGINNDNYIASPVAARCNSGCITVLRVNANVSSPSASTPAVSIYVNSDTMSNTTYSTSNSPSNLALTTNEVVVGARAVDRSATEMTNGSISEVIIFDRALLNDEVRSVNSYLSKKYSIKLL